MLSLAAKIRKETGKKVKNLRGNGVLPGILYGSKIKNTVVEINLRDFEKIFREAGESSLISLEVDGKKIPVLIHEFQKDHLTDKFTHVDFYQPSLEKEIVAKVPLLIEGEAPAVKELGGTLVKAFSELEVKALPQDLPHQIAVNVNSLKTFEDRIKISDLELLKGVKIIKDAETILAFVAQPEKVEEELVKPIEEKVEEVGVAGEKKKEEEVSEEKGETKEAKKEEKEKK